MALVNVKNQIYLDLNDLVLVVDIKQVDEKTISNATNLCGKDKNGKPVPPLSLVKLRHRDRDLLLPTLPDTLMKKIN